MDEAEKYQQRLLAIAEKRRLQEEQERAKRELEDEKLRLQQLKRKSLRDQWLMEGPPMSPESAGPRSPLWGPQAQHIEARIEKLQGETERLSEAAERLQEHMDDTASTQPHTEGGDAVKPVTAGHLVQDGQEEVEQAAEGVQKMVETPSVPTLTNGAVGDEKSHSAPLQDGLAYANGLPDGPITLTFLGFSDLELGQGVCDDDDNSTIIHAERVIITDEGDEVTEVSIQEHLQAQVPGEHMAPKEETVEPDGRTEVEAETVEIGSQICNHLDISADPANSVHDTVIEGRENDTDISTATSTDLTRANSTATSTTNNTDNGTDATASVATDNPADGVLDVQIVAEIPALTKEQFHGKAEEAKLRDGPAEGAEMSPILELLRMQCSAVPILEVDTQCKPQQEHTSHVTPFSTSQFQEIPLDKAGESSTKPPALKQQLEKEPLLASKDTPLTDSARANQAEGADGPKMKTCQCCCVM